MKTMNTKPHLTTIAIIAILFLFCFSVHAQSSADTIRIEKKGLGYVYYKGSEMLNYEQVLQLNALYPEALKLIEKSTTMRTTSYVFGIIGGAVIGGSIGYVLGVGKLGVMFNMPSFLTLLGTGVVFAGIGVGCEISANNKAKQGVKALNHAIRQKNNTSINLSLSANGALLRLNF
jgi:hypothetical protein